MGRDTGKMRRYLQKIREDQWHEIMELSIPVKFPRIQLVKMNAFKSICVRSQKKEENKKQQQKNHVKENKT